jgi:hypothetical protein
MQPETRYAKSGDVSIAYQVFGEGPINLVLSPFFISNVEPFWEDPDLSRWLMRMASFARVAMFDKRGTGMSDRVDALHSFSVGRLRDFPRGSQLKKRLASFSIMLAKRGAAALPRRSSYHLVPAIRHSNAGLVVSSGSAQRQHLSPHTCG